MKVNAPGSDGNVGKWSPLWIFKVYKHQVEKELVNMCWEELAVMGRNINEETLMVSSLSY